MPINKEEIQQFSRLELLAKQVVEGFITGLHKSPFHGFSVEFAEHRIYNQGESTKNIDWKLYARTDKMYSKRYEEETNLRCQIIIDNSSSMYFPFNKDKEQARNKIEFSVLGAAAIMELLRKQRDAVGLSIFSGDIEVHTKAKSSGAHHKRLMFEMEKLLDKREVEDQRSTKAIDALHQIAENIHKRSLVVIFSDMIETFQDEHDFKKKEDQIFSALQHLKHNKHEVILFHVHDKSKEINFEFDNRPYKFVDLETGEEVKVMSTDVKNAYVNAMKNYKQELKYRCGQYKIDFIEADINEGFNQVLQQYLIKRSKLY